MPLSNLLKEFPVTRDFVPLDADYAQCSIHQYIERVASRYPDNLAVSDNGLTLTYGQLNQKANQLARHIETLQSSEIVALYLPNSINMVIGFLAVLKTDKAVVMLNLAAPKDRIRWLVENAGIRVIITDQKNYEPARKNFDQPIVITNLATDIEGYPDYNLDNIVSSESPAVLVYTSGSTGTPKGVMHKHKAWMESMGASVVRDKMLLTDRMAQNFSPGSAAAVITIVLTLISGASLFIYDSQSRGLNPFIGWAQENQITVFRMASSSFRQIFTEVPKNIKLTRVRLVIIGGELIQANDFEIYKRHFSQSAYFRIGGGMSEALLIASCYLNHKTTLSRKLMPMGYIYSSCTVEIWDEDKRPVPHGEVGEIVVIGPSVADSYWRKPEESHVFIVDPEDSNQNTYRTGDTGFFEEDNLLYIVGRKDNMVKIRGYRVELGEVEAHLLSIPSILRACVIAHPTKIGKLQLVAYLVMDVQQMVSIKEIRDELSESIPTYMIPAQYVFLETFPLNKTGKIDRKALPPPNKQRPNLGVPYVRPETDIETELIIIWSEILGFDKIGINDEFTLLGGDSLSAVQIFLMIENALNQKLPPSFLLDAPTIRQLAKKIMSLRQEKLEPLITLQQGKEGEPELILFTPILGDLITYRDIINEWPQEYTLHGIHSWIEERESFIELSVNEIVDRYLPYLLKAQPQGPYYLGGSSFGGVLAYHAAYRLKEMGKQVGFVFLLDTAGPGKSYQSHFVNNPFKVFIEYMQSDRTAKEKLAYIFLSIRIVIMFILGPIIQKIPVGASPAKEKHETKIQSNALKQDYHAQPLAVDVLLFRATDTSWEHMEGETKGWHHVVKGKLKIIALAGTHTTHFRGDNAKKIVEVLLDNIIAPNVKD